MMSWGIIVLIIVGSFIGGIMAGLRSTRWWLKRDNLKIVSKEVNNG